MVDGVPAGPSWLGIGAQRSGTTWLTDLLTQHPQVGLGTNGKKEQHLLQKVADRRVPEADYLDLFPADGVRRGDWTPQYLRHASVPAAAARLLPDVPVLVVLRDPVERFRSAMRLAATREAAGNPSPWPYPVPITVQTWTGMYADQLDMWAAAVGRDRMHVLVFEQARTDPQATLDRLWSVLGLDPVALSGVQDASGSSSRADWQWTPGLEDSLRALYRPQLQRLRDDWGLDLGSWRSVAADPA
ncbi:sulfotransferase [Nocardioides sp. C4-1]|uniref:sulfotransferase family protein n=1 Tax=Nocardioides sp. C4-1 TaxID=3151851 RepID=UPI00326309CC